MRSALVLGGTGMLAGCAQQLVARGWQVVLPSRTQPLMADDAPGRAARATIARGHRPTTLGLKLEYRDAASLTCGHVDRIARDINDLAWRRGRRERFDARFQHDQSSAIKVGVGMRPRVEAAHPVVNRCRRKRPVDQAFFFREAWGQRES